VTAPSGALPVVTSMMQTARELRPAVGALLEAARSHDANAMRAALHAIDPSINIS